MTEKTIQKSASMTNYETWALNVWMHNENYNSLMSELYQIYISNPKDSKYIFADKLKEIVLEGKPKVGGLYEDLLSHSILTINFFEIGERWVQDLISNM